MTVLLDANVLIALVMAEHVHHRAASAWLTQRVHGHFATCPVTQGSLIRFLLRDGQSADTALTVVAGLEQNPRHEFWADDLTYTDVPMRGVVGHRQVTDAYLAQLTRVRVGRLATFDQGLANLHGDIADLVPTQPPTTGERQNGTQLDGRG